MNRPSVRCATMTCAAVVLTAVLAAVAPLASQQLGDRASPTSSLVVRDQARAASPLVPDPAGGGPMLLIEPFAGRLHFADELGGQRQELLGVAAGVEFTRYFALRGFYWRGTSPSFTEVQPLQSYGGEAQLTFRAPPLFTFLLGGLGQVDFGNGDGAVADPLPADHRAFILGGGIGLALGSRLRVSVALRDYIVREEVLDGAAEANRTLLHNPLLSVGLTLALGGEPPQSRRGAARVQRDRLDQDIEQAFAERDRFMARIQERRAEVEEQRRREAGLLGRPVHPQGAPVTRDAERTVVVPVPAQGEIYIRYGTPGGVRIESGGQVSGSAVLRPPPQLDPRGLSPLELRALIRDAVREELGQQATPQFEAAPRVEELAHPGRARVLIVPPAPAPSPGAPAPALTAPAVTAPVLTAPAPTVPGLTPEERFELLERRLLQRIDELIEQRLREREQRALPAPAPPGP